MAATEISSVKALTESTDLTSIPPHYIFKAAAVCPGDHQTLVPEDQEDSIPIIDFSLLTSADPDQRSKIVRELEKACQDWGIFMVINHGVDERQINEIFDWCGEFFNLKEEEKKKFEGKNALDTILYGTSFYGAAAHNIFLWRDFLKLTVHPEFHCPNKPHGFSKVVEEYSGTIRKVAAYILGAMSESLGLEPGYIEKTMNFDSTSQVFVANLYPPCPQPELTMGLPPHTDHGLVTFLTYNGVHGLQVHHKGRWVDVQAVPGAFLVNIGDHTEILSNGKYKSCRHRAVVNNKSTRISVVVANGPSSDAFVGPAPELVDSKSNPAAYAGMKYIDYLKLQHSNKLKGKTALDHVKI